MMSGNTIWHCSCAKRASKFVISNWSRSASVSTVIYFWSLHINLVPVYFSVYFQKSGPQPDQQSLLKRNSPAGQQEAPVTPADDLHWSKTLAKLQSQNQALSTELNKVKNENDELQSKLRQAERDTRDRREQSTNTPSNIHDRCVCVYILYINFISKKTSCLFDVKRGIHLCFSLQYCTGSITLYPSERRVSPLFHPAQFGYAGNQLWHRRHRQHPATDNSGQQPLIKKLQDKTHHPTRTNFSVALIAELHGKEHIQARHLYL